MNLVTSIEFENDTIRLLRVSGYRLHPNFPRGDGRSSYYRKPGRKIEHVVVHTLAGSFRKGDSVVKRLADFHTSSPKWKRDESGEIVRRKGKPVRAGGGRGWPGPAYGFLVPFWPDVEDGRLVVYRVWDDEWITFATGGQNLDTISVGCAGSHRTRHMPKWSAGQARDPERTQFLAAQSLIQDYLLPRYGLGPDALRGHFDFGKPACPGDVFEAWVREMRGEDVGWLEPSRRLWEEHDMRQEPVELEPDRRPLETWLARQEALVELGFDVGPAGVDGIFGEDTRSAVEAFQESEGLVVDGFWGPQTEAAIRLALAK